MMMDLTSVSVVLQPGSGSCLLPTAYCLLSSLFITPWFAAAGALAISIPIIIHILNRRRFKVVIWAAMEYLLQAMRKNRRKLKFEQWLLLAVRCCVLLLLGLALARPLGCDNNSLASLVGQRNGLHVFIIDNSYSMSYIADRAGAKTHLDQAKLMTKAMIDRLARGGESVAIITAGAAAASDSDPAGAHAIVGKPSYNLDSCKTAVDGIGQSYGATDMAHALELALQMGREETKQPRKSLYILSDGTRSAWEGPQAARLKQLGPDLAKVYRVSHWYLGKANQWNQAVVSVKPIDNLVTTKFRTDLAAQVRGFGNGADNVLIWQIDKQSQPVTGPVHLDLNTPPQMLANKSFAVGGPHVVSVALEGSDRVACDDTRYRVVDVAADMKVLVVEGERSLDAEGGSAAPLENALAPPSDNSAPGAGKTNSYVSLEVISDIELGNKVLNQYRAICLADVAQIPTVQAQQLTAFVEQGGSLMIFMGPHINAESYNATLLPPKSPNTVGLLPGKLIKTLSNDQKPFFFDFNPKSVHPYLSDFKGVPNSGLGTAQVFSYWQLELPPNSTAQRILDYLPAGSAPNATQPSSGDRAANVGTKDPAITVHALGRGQVIFFSTTANGEWMTLPGKPAYTALMHELLGGSVGEADRWMNITVGDRVEVPPSLGLIAAPKLTDAAKKSIPVEPEESKDGQTLWHTRPMVRPGLYWLNTGKSTIPIAVNVPGDDGIADAVPEADIRTIPPEGVKKALGDIPMELETDALPAAGITRNSGSDFGWYFMIAVLAFVGLECFLAMRFGHYRRVAQTGAPAAPGAPVEPAAPARSAA